VITRHLLYLTSDGLSAYVWRRGQLAREAGFTADEAGPAGFAAYLEAHRKAEFRILANLRDESQQVEIIPYLRRGDRQSFITRKMGRLFAGTPLARAVSLGYEKTGRRNERVLLSALTQVADFEPWLACFSAAGAALAGVYTLSQLGGALLGKAGKLPERCLLLTRQDSSLRETFMVGGEPWFSRLVPMTEGEDGDPAAALAREAARLRQYLAGQSLIGHQDTLPVFVLGHPSRQDRLPAPAAETGGLSFIPIDNRDLAARMGLKTLPEDDRSELLFLHLLATGAPRSQFADSSLRRHWRFLQFRRALFAGTALLTLALLSLAGKGLHDSRNLRGEAFDLSAREKALISGKQEPAMEKSRLPADHATLRRVSARFAELHASQSHPAEAYRIVSRALDKSPAIELDSIDWKRTPAAGSPCCRETITVEGALASDSPPRQARAAFGDFVRLLEEDASLKVEVRRSPQVPAPEDAGQSARQLFAIRIDRKPAP
jgi:hypothetical protein